MPKDITAEFLRSVLDYCPETGIFRWVKRTSNRIQVGDLAGREDVHGYWCIGLCRVVHKAHRLAWLHFYGEWPHGEIDHINGDGLDNSIRNLRDVSPTENRKNMPLPKTNTSGSIGVSWERSRRKWYAYIQVSGRTRPLGRFTTKSDAIAARADAEKLLGFHENHGRAV